MWQHVKLSEQIRPWDTLACCWDVKQPTNKQTSMGFAAHAPLFGSRAKLWTLSLVSDRCCWWFRRWWRHLVSSLAGQKCSEAWGTFWTWTGQSITALITWRKEEWRKEAADIPTSKVKNDLCSTRQILALFRGQPWGDCWETGRSAHGPFRALWWHLELKPKLPTRCGLCGSHESPPRYKDGPPLVLKTTSHLAFDVIKKVFPQKQTKTPACDLTFLHVHDRHLLGQPVEKLLAKPSWMTTAKTAILTVWQ